MAVIRSKAEVDLRIPGGPMLRAGRRVRIDRWQIVKGHATVKAWLAAGLIEEVSEKVEPRPRAAPINSLAELRSAYQNTFGKRPWHGWSEDELKAKIEAVPDVHRQD